MQKIRLEDIDFSKLQKLNTQGSTSTLYRQDNKCLKILDKLTEEEKKIIYKKYYDMDGIILEDVLQPIEFIMSGDNLEGYTTEYFENSLSINDYFSCTRYLNCNDLFVAVKKASLILRKIHSQEVILQDLSFDNILISKEGVVKYCDIDACIYNNNVPKLISMLLKYYLLNYRKERIHVSINVDKLSMMLSFFYLIHLKELQKISAKNYKSLSDHIVTLENARPYAEMLKNKKCSISEIPYLDELIDDQDNYIIDRMTQVGMIRKLINSFDRKL